MRASPFLLACARSNASLCARPAHKKVPAATTATCSIRTSGSISACSPERVRTASGRGGGGAEGALFCTERYKYSILQLVSSRLSFSTAAPHTGRENTRLKRGSGGRAGTVCETYYTVAYTGSILQYIIQYQTKDSVAMMAVYRAQTLK